MDLKGNWNLLRLQSRDHFKSSTLLLHHAIQILAVVERDLSPKQKKHENAWLKYHSTSNQVMSNWIDTKKHPVKIGLRLTDLQLTIFKPSLQEVVSISLQGKTKEEIFDWLIGQLEEMKVEISPMKMDLLYCLPDHKTDNGAPFEISNKEEMIALAEMRANISHTLRYYANYYNDKKPILIHPKTFETSYKIPVSVNKSGKVIRSVRFGLSIPDTICDHYYFYVSHYDHKDITDYEKLKQLGGDGYWVVKNRVMAVLPLHKFYPDRTHEEQTNRVTSFFTSALNNTFDILICPKLKISSN